MDAKTLRDYYAIQMLRPLPLEDVEKLRIIRDALSLAAAVEGPEATHRLVPIDKMEGNSDAV